jgi:hypothetical protein
VKNWSGISKIGQKFVKSWSIIDQLGQVGKKK